MKQSYECHSMNTYTLTTLTCTKNSKKINTNMDTKKYFNLIRDEKKQEELDEVGFSKLGIKSFNFNIAENQFLL